MSGCCCNDKVLKLLNSEESLLMLTVHTDAVAFVLSASC